MRLGLLQQIYRQWTGRRQRRPRVRVSRRLHNRLGLLDSLESRVLLSGFGAAPAADVQSDPTAVVAYEPRDRFAWSARPGGSAEVSVFVKDDAASPFSPDQRARIGDAIAELNRAWDAVRGVGLKLVAAAENSLAHIVVSQNSTSACGGRQHDVLGCAAYYVYTAPSGTFTNGDDLHRFAGPEAGVQTQVTLIAGWNWFSGSDATEITTEQFDFTTVVTHELAHAVGLDHDADDSHSDNSTQEPLNGDGESALAPTLAAGETHRKLSDEDVAELQFLYASAASDDVATATDSTASEPASDEPSGDPTDPANEACDAPNPDDSQDETGDGNEQDDDCDTDGNQDGMEGEGVAGEPQPEVIFIEPSRAAAVPLTQATTISAALRDGLARERRAAPRQVTTANAFPESGLPVRAITNRSIAETNQDLAVFDLPALRTEFIACSQSATELHLKAPTGTRTSSQIVADANRTRLAQVFKTVFAESISRARAAVTTGVTAGHRAESGSEIDTAGLGLTAVLIGGLWGAQASEPKRPTWQFLLDHLLDRSN